VTAGSVAINASTPNASTPDGRSTLVAWSVAFGLGLALVGAGLVASTPLPILGGAAVFFFFAVASDVRSLRVPNLLTLPALLGAVLLSPWLGATSGPLEAAVGAALGFGLLVGPYTLGGMGAGDVKALMVLGAWIGPEAVFGATVWAVIAAGGFGLALLTLRGEIGPLARRWSRTLVAVLILRRFAYEPPAAGPGAASGIPFAAALAVGLAVQWFQGSPW
jgi:prepilin peptidase CpaA